MYTYYGLQGVERILCGVLLIVDVCLRDNVVLLVSANQVYVLLAVLVYGSLDAEVFLNGIAKLLAELRVIFDNLFEHRGVELQEYRVSHGTYRDGRVSSAEQVGLAKILAVTQQGYAQFLAVSASRDNLSLTVGNDEEFLLILALSNEILASRHLNRLEVLGKTSHYVLVNMLEHRNGTQILGCETWFAFEILYLDAVSLFQFHLSAVNAIGATFYLSPRQELKQKTWSDGAHLRGRLGSVRKFASCLGSNTTLNVVVCHNCN